jgi:hypothetical protein
MPLLPRSRLAGSIITTSNPDTPLDAATELASALTTALIAIEHGLDHDAPAAAIDLALDDAHTTAIACVKALENAIAFRKAS